MERDILRNLTLRNILKYAHEGIKSVAELRERIIETCVDFGFYPGKILREKGLDLREKDRRRDCSFYDGEDRRIGDRRDSNRYEDLDENI